MTNKNLPTHGSFRTEPLISKNVIVFVHGIFSDHETFNTMTEKFRENREFESWELVWFEYDFHQSIEESGAQLAVYLKDQYNDASVVLVCHSMGGLVGRMAILSGNAKCVTKLFLIGTPNFGAVRTGKMTVAALLALGTSRKLWGVFHRQQGVLDLTNINGVLGKYFDKNHDKLKNADKVEYITIPGLFFHENRSPKEKGNWGEWEKEQNWFTELNLGIKILNGFQSVFNIHIELPHDGIVEEISNCMKPPTGRQEAYWSEKFAQIEYPESELSTYAHLPHVNARELTHTRIHNDKEIIGLVMSLALADNLDKWYADLVNDKKQKFFLRKIDTLDEAQKRQENEELRSKLDKMFQLLSK
jgi:hypothetical protein